MDATFLKNIEACSKHELTNLISVEPGSVESRTFFQSEAYSITLFSFDGGEGVSAFAVPGDTFIYVFEGESLITVNDDTENFLQTGDSIFISSDDVYSIDAEKSCKLLIMLVKAPLTK